MTFDAIEGWFARAAAWHAAEARRRATVTSST